MQSSGNKPAAAAPPPPAAEPKASPSEFKAGGAMEQFVMPGAEYPPHSRRLKNIQMIKYNFYDDMYDDSYYRQQDMYYPNHGGYHAHAISAPPYHRGMRHMSAPPPQYSNYPPPPPPYGHGHGHYPPAQRHFSPAPPPWQRYSPAPAPWGQFGQRQQFGPPRRYFGPPRPRFGAPRRPFAPPMGHDYYGDY
ncbi:hypothetical protein AgCh_032336 [Apium graveolens]